MLNDLRQQAEPSFAEEETPPFGNLPPQKPKFLGMTPFQRFIVALLLLMAACILSSFCLLVTEKVVLPFL